MPIVFFASSANVTDDHEYSEFLLDIAGVTFYTFKNRAFQVFNEDFYWGAAAG